MDLVRTVFRSAMTATAGLVVAGGAAATPAHPPPPERALRFEPAPAGEVGFVSRGRTVLLRLTPAGVTLEAGDRHSSTRATLSMRFSGASPAAEPTGIGPLPERKNTYIGRRERWRVEVPQYSAIRYRGIYPGIDAVVRAAGSRWEYDFLVAPGANPRDIRLRFEGATAMAIDAAGDLVLDTAAGAVRHARPLIYQDLDGHRVAVAGTFVRRGRREVGFRVDAYNKSQPLVIDPAIVFATEGAVEREVVLAAAVDSSGATYVTGFDGNDDAFVVKLDVAGNPVYSTYLGGTQLDVGIGIVADSAGNAYVTGQTASEDFPATPDALKSSFGDPHQEQGDAFVVKLDPMGALVYGSLFGGDGQDDGTAIALDGSDNVYLTGQTNSTDSYPPTDAPTFPIVNPIGPQPPGEYGLVAYVTKLSPTFSILWSTVVPGTEIPWGIVVDPADNVFIAGETARTDLPAAGGFQPALGGPLQNDGFIVKLDPTGGAVAYATYLGGSRQDGAFSLAVDRAGSALVTGLTRSLDFPVASAFDPELGHHAHYDAFVAKLNPAGSDLVFSTYLGGSLIDEGYGITTDATGNVFVTGETASGGDFPTLRASQRFYGGGWSDAFVAKFDPAGVPVYITYLGDGDDEFGRAVVVDHNGEPRVAGHSVPGGWFAVHYDNSYTYNPAYTPSAENVVVVPENATTQTSPVTLTFQSVDQDGETSLTSSSTGPAPPSGFQLGDPATYYELSTTALFSGTVEVCIRYAGVSYTNETALTLSHYEGGSWTDVTTSLDTVTKVICGTVASLSPFALFEPAAAPPGYTFIGFLPPIRKDGETVFRAGRVIPAKFQLRTAAGGPVIDAVATLEVLLISDEVLGTVEVITPHAAGTANTGNLFRYDPVAEQYIYNLDTRDYAPGTYRLRAHLDDRATHEVRVSVR